MTEVGEGMQSPEVKTPVVERTQNKVVEFLKSQMPAAHTERLMNFYDKVASKLPENVQEVYTKVRPAVEIGAKVQGVGFTATEVVGVAAAGAGAVWAGKEVGGKVLNKVVSPELKQNAQIKGAEMIRGFNTMKDEAKLRLDSAGKGIKDRVGALVTAIRSRIPGGRPPVPPTV